jgi:hypothetical protein
MGCRRYDYDCYGALMVREIATQRASAHKSAVPTACIPFRRVGATSGARLD